MRSQICYTNSCSTKLIQELPSKLAEKNSLSCLVRLVFRSIKVVLQTFSRDNDRSSRQTRGLNSLVWGFCLLVFSLKVKADIIKRTLHKSEIKSLLQLVYFICSLIWSISSTKTCLDCQHIPGYTQKSWFCNPKCSFHIYFRSIQ